jgi:hypothetical protein
VPSWDGAAAQTRVEEAAHESRVASVQVPLAFCRGAYVM